MPVSSIAPELFVIKAVSSKTAKPERENYIVLTRLNDGSWTTTPLGLEGIYSVRWFLHDNCVERKRIALAIEELCRTRETHVSNRPD